MVGTEGEKAGGKGTDDEVLRRLKERSVTPGGGTPLSFLLPNEPVLQLSDLLFCLSHAKPGHAGPEGGGPWRLPSLREKRWVLPLPAAYGAPRRGRSHKAPAAPRRLARARESPWLWPRRRSPPWHQRALPPHGRRHGHRWRRSGVYVKDAAYPGGRRRSPRRRRRPAEAALVNRGLGEPRMEVAVAAAAVGRALRRAGGKGGRGRGGPGPGSGASGAAGWAESRARGGRPDGSAGGGAAATRACGRCEVHGAPGTGVGMVTPAALSWAAWV